MKAKLSIIRYDDMLALFGLQVGEGTSERQD